METLNLKDYLPLVRKPSRYIGGEVNSIKKDLFAVRLKFALCFPDTYEVGMSHLGIQLLYQILNDRPDIACERAFAPWKDMEGLLKEKNIPLATLESMVPLKDFDIVGFSLQYELSYTNVLNMLSLGGIPLLARMRGESDPIVIGGGPCAFNPEPVAEFFDCFLLGDGEEAVIKICDAVMEGSGLNRREILENLSEVAGVYVPKFFDVQYNDDSTVKNITSLKKGYVKVKKAIVADLDRAGFPVKPVVAFTEAIHDRLTVEIARGCTRGCRFCQAGMITRPIRERDPEKVMGYVLEALRNTGYEDVGLLSLSAGDYCAIEGLVSSLMNILTRFRVGITLPSLRVSTVGDVLAEEIKRVRKTGFTLAPEAGSPRLRRVINKELDEKALVEFAEAIFRLGWKAIKLYFMVGLPEEGMEDVVAISRLSKLIKDCGRKYRGKTPQVTVSVASFIPKPFTPFQWHAQLSLGHVEERIGLLRDLARENGLTVRWHDGRMSRLEGVFSRGDRRLSRVILRAFEKGLRFDGWREEFNWEKWLEAFKEEGLDMAFYTERVRPKDEIFPWDHLDCGVEKAFLYEEYERGKTSELTPDCRKICTQCGVCDFKTIKNIIHKTEVNPKPFSLKKRGDDFRRARISFEKRGSIKFLSHLELASVVLRAMRRAGLPIRYSQGFHPLPKISYMTPQPVGIESREEYMDVEFYTEKTGNGQAVINGLDVIKRFNEALSCIDGLRVNSIEFMPLQKSRPSGMITAQRYRVSLKNSPLGLNIESSSIDEALREFFGRDSVLMEIERDGRRKVVDLKTVVSGISLEDAFTMGFTLKKGEINVKPAEVLSHLFKLPPEQSSLIPVLKTKTIL